MPNDSSRTMLKLLSASFAIVAVALIGSAVAHAQSGAVIYRFKGDTGGLHDGAGPDAPLTLGRDGNFYGTTYSGGTVDTCDGGDGNAATCGTVFQLTPPAAEGLSWQETVLYSFGSEQPDGLNPYRASLVMDDAGNLYGTTPEGGILSTECSGNPAPYWCGTVFQLVPPTTKGGSWTRNLIYEFLSSGDDDGIWPLAGLILDKQGNLYGTTEAGGYGVGTVFELTPPNTQGGSWTESVLYNFGVPASDGAWPTSNLLMDHDGNLFGTTALGGTAACACGTVFELSPPKAGGVWTEKTLYSFQAGSDGNSPNGLIVNKDGTFYGTTQGGWGNSCGFGLSYCGTVFQLKPPSVRGGAWQETVLHNFTGGGDGSTPYGNLILDPGGRLFGTTWSGGNGCTGHDCGTVFELFQRDNTWVEKVLYAFKDKADGALPLAGLTLGNNYKLYGTAPAGGVNCDSIYFSGCGVIFEISK